MPDPGGSKSRTGWRSSCCPEFSPNTKELIEMAAVAKAEKTAAEEPKAGPTLEPPVIKSANVRVNVSGHVWRTVEVRCSEGMVSDDIRNPKIWRVVQGIPASALLKGDEL